MKSNPASTRSQIKLSFPKGVPPITYVVQDLAPKVRKQLDEYKVYLEYGTYAKFRRKIIKPE